MENSNTTPDITLKGTIKYIKFDADMFQAFVFSTDKNEQINCKSTLPKGSLKNNDKVTLVGHWVNNPTYGKQFEVIVKTTDVPIDVEGIHIFLVKHIKGVGKKIADNIIEKFGTKTWEIIENSPEDLCEVNGISITRARKIAAEYTDKVGARDDIIWFNRHLINNGNYITEIKKKFGTKYKEIIENNPYILVEVNGLGFKKADAIARTFGVELDSPFRIAAGLKAVLMAVQDLGSVYLTRDDLISKACNLLGVSSEKIIEILNRLLETDSEKRKEDPVCFIKLVNDNGAIYEAGMLYKEEYIANTLKSFKENSPSCPSMTDEEIATLLNEFANEGAEESFKLDKSQVDAAIVAIRNSVSIITGGPGTGKTTTLNTIINFLEKKADVEHFRLLAPTGKAAKRMSEQTGRFATTIHKAVGFGGTDEMTISDDVVIIDEMSMTDMNVMFSLLKALSPDVKRLIFVGDIDQLPSVGAGNVLKDMIDSGVIPLSRLNVIHRQAEQSGIIRYSQAVINEMMFPENPDVEDFVFINNSNADTVEEQVIDMYTTGIPEWLKEKGLDPTSVQILSPFKDPARELSSGCFNNKIQKRNAELSKSEHISFFKDKIIYYVGDKVIHTKNNYKMKRQQPNGKISEGVMNGETGTVIEVDDKLKLMTVKYDDGDIGVYNKDNIGEIALAYALTVHRSQGSEYQAVIIPIVTGGMSSIMNKNLLYTAITRAKSMVIIIGSKSVLARMVHTRYSEKRNTKLAERLHQPLENIKEA